MFITPILPKNICPCSKQIADSLKKIGLVVTLEYLQDDKMCIHMFVFSQEQVKGGESSSQFRWFTIAKIELYFLIFFVLILGLRLQRYLINTKRCPPEKSFWKL